MGNQTEDKITPRNKAPTVSNKKVLSNSEIEKAIEILRTKRKFYTAAKRRHGNK